MKMFMVPPPRLAVTVDQSRVSLTLQKSILLGAMSSLLANPSSPGRMLGRLLRVYGFD